MKRVMVVGGAGMLGHKLAEQLGGELDVWTTVRGGFDEIERYGIFARERTLTGVDVRAFDTLIRAVSACRPDAIVNCVGVIKQLPTARDPLVSIEINSLFPHRLAELARAAGARAIHISTDCVFSGRRGMYTEADPSDAEDLYGRSKFLGEIAGTGALTLRTSIIGRELRGTSGLVEWFLSQRGGVSGYTEAKYTGLTTLALSRVIRDILIQHPDLSGVVQVSSDVISKYDLLLLLRQAYGIEIEIEPSNEVRIDRSLDGSRFRAATGFRPQPWPEMIQEMAGDSGRYAEWRRQGATRG